MTDRLDGLHVPLSIAASARHVQLDASLTSYVSAEPSRVSFHPPDEQRILPLLI
jgi:hypothetical protein